jgi:hypothetical protein
MDGTHSLYLQLTVTVASTYNGRVPLHLPTMDGYHDIYLQWTVTIASTHNGRLP